LNHLCLAPVQMGSLSSPALLTRMLDRGIRTVLIDEVDRNLDPKREGMGDLLAVLNSGYKRGATRPVLVGANWEVREMPTFAPVAMAGISPHLPDDTRSRTIRVVLLPDLDGTVEPSDWEDIDADAAALAGDLSTWADEARDGLRDARPVLPPECTGRARERWSPLARVAHAAGGRWPELAADLIGRDLEDVRMDREDWMTTQAPSVVLLRDLARLWPVGADFAQTVAVLLPSLL
jgi:Protein of unknown function (DUF3631)